MAVTQQSGLKNSLGVVRFIRPVLKSYGTRCDSNPNECGHGTHVAGIIVAQPAETKEPTEYVLFAECFQLK